MASETSPVELRRSSRSNVKPSDADREASGGLLSEDSMTDGSTHARQQSLLQHASVKANELWLYESLAAFISLTCLLGIVLTLRAYDGKPGPRWPWRININALIAILTVLLKGTMIFVLSQGLSQLKWIRFIKPRPLSDYARYEYASRGPWGAALFVMSTSLDTLATLGAIIMIVAIAVEPFAQQVLTYRPCLTPDAGTNATISRLDKFDISPTQDPKLPRYLMSSLVSLDTPTVPAIGASCSSGNCSFVADRGLYQDLAYIYNCSDITSTVEKKSANDSEWPQFNMYSIPMPANTTQLNVSYSTNTAFSASVGSRGLAMIAFNTTTPYSKNKQMSEIVSIDESILAVECEIRPAVRTMNNEMISGQWKPIQIAADTDTLQDMYDRQQIRWLPPKNQSIEDGLRDQEGDLTVMSIMGLPDRAVQNGQWMDCENTTTWSPSHTVGLTAHPDPVVDGDQNELPNDDPEYRKVLFQNLYFRHAACVYYITVRGMDAIGQAYSEVFRPNMYTSDPAVISAYVVEGAWEQVQQNQTNMPLSSLWQTGRLTFQDVDNYASRIVDSINAGMLAMVEQSATDNTPASGTLLLSNTCMIVRWWWIALPAALTMLTILFLALTIISAWQHSRSPNWPGLLKGSPLALVFYQPVEDPSIHYEGKVDPTSLEDISSRVKTTLERRHTTLGKSEEALDG